MVEFDPATNGWDDYLLTPWARVRYDMVGQVLDGSVDGLSGPAGVARNGRSLRVLDLGGGDGLDSVRFTASGHDVTVVDATQAMLDRARTAHASSTGTSDKGALWTIRSDAASWTPDGMYDLVLCHFLLHLVEDWPAVCALAQAATAPGGVISVICPNPASDVLRAVRVEGDPGLALRRLAGEPAHSVAMNHPIRPIWRQEVVAALRSDGFLISRELGLRTAIDLMPESPAKRDPAGYDLILKLEWALCERDPYRDLARAWQVVAERPARGFASETRRR